MIFLLHFYGGNWYLISHKIGVLCKSLQKIHFFGDEISSITLTWKYFVKLFYILKIVKSCLSSKEYLYRLIDGFFNIFADIIDLVDTTDGFIGIWNVNGWHVKASTIEIGSFAKFLNDLHHNPLSGKNTLRKNKVKIALRATSFLFTRIDLCTFINVLCNK